MRLNKDEVYELMVKQAELNSAFTVSRWDDPLVTTAFLVEYAEFMNECRSIWKVWKDSDDNVLNAKVEFIDCVHFGLSLLLLRAESDQQGYDIGIQYDRPLISEEMDFLSRVTKTTTNFVSWNNSFPLSMLNFIDFVDCITKEFRMDKEEFLRYLKIKTKINMDRVNGGYKEGTYSGKETENEQFE